MCSISLNSTVENQLNTLGDAKKRKKFEKRVFRLADEAKTDISGALDLTSCHMKRMPQDLREIRKTTIGRHRLFFTGYHTQCRYVAFYLKLFKQYGVNDEDDKAFQNILRRALEDPPILELSLPNESTNP
jgi:hypothetical protein